MVRQFDQSVSSFYISKALHGWESCQLLHLWDAAIICLPEHRTAYCRAHRGYVAITARHNLKCKFRVAEVQLWATSHAGFSPWPNYCCAPETLAERLPGKRARKWHDTDCRVHSHAYEIVIAREDRTEQIIFEFSAELSDTLNISAHCQLKEVLMFLLHTGLDLKNIIKLKCLYSELISYMIIGKLLAFA